MKLAELRALPKGTKLMFHEGNGWYTEVKFLGIAKVTTYGKMCFSDIANGKFDFSKGKESLEAIVEYEGRPRAVSPRKLKK